MNDDVKSSAYYASRPLKIVPPTYGSLKIAEFIFETWCIIKVKMHNVKFVMGKYKPIKQIIDKLVVILYCFMYIHSKLKGLLKVTKIFWKTFMEPTHLAPWAVVVSLLELAISRLSPPSFWLAPARQGSHPYSLLCPCATYLLDTT